MLTYMKYVHELFLTQNFLTAQVLGGKLPAPSPHTRYITVSKCRPIHFSVSYDDRLRQFFLLDSKGIITWHHDMVADKGQWDTGSPSFIWSENNAKVSRSPRDVLPRKLNLKYS